VDVRETTEYAEGHIPGAINIPIRELAKNLDKIRTDEPVVLSCASGLRCTLAMPALHLLGYTNVRTFPPSFNGWKAANEAIEK
jgi:rhodanese-related sulfurtransferase